MFLGFPGGSAGKEPTCNAGDLGWMPGWEDPLEKGTATHSFGLENSMDYSPWGSEGWETIERHLPLQTAI